MHLLIAAAGSGRRMGADKNKLLLNLAGRAVLAWTLDAAFGAESIHWIGVVGQNKDKESIMGLVVNTSKPIQWIEGGETRQESVKRGLAALPADATQVLIHDGARCMVDPAFFDKCSEEMLSGQAVIAATPITDTIKQVDSHGLIEATLDRSVLWAAQTPQGFLVEDLRRAHVEAEIRGWSVTDDASLYERLGWPVKVLESSPSNIKVTTPFDLSVAEALLEIR